MLEEVDRRELVIDLIKTHGIHTIFFKNLILIKYFLQREKIRWLATEEDNVDS